MMKEISINFVDFWDGFDKENNPYYNILTEKYHVVLSNHPQYLFYGPYGNENLAFLDCIRIFTTGENISPDFNLCDYALGFDYLSFGDRYLRRPNFYGREKDLKLCMEKHTATHQPKTEFCSFVVSKSTAGSADPIREQIFLELSKYKKVNSGGRFMNNIGMPNGVPDKLEFQKKHKFAIAFENSSQPGYTTEKIVDAFAAGCVPIYWGDPWVDKVFNENAFINVNKFSTIEEAIQEIIRIDNDDVAFEQMLRAPALLNAYDYPEAMYERLKAFLFNIVEQPYDKARRRASCSYVENYEKQMQKLLADEPFRKLSKKYAKQKHKLSMKIRSLFGTKKK